ncbi:hypothetical protein C8F04DRAFT_1192232 [Mycena alexandri]|uniref:Uncharacterized protein n=1 Tax=Mycena alexandri TaxID=1745969 RepID=A0AAD6SB85_9AGAR|nr:hypothetical protein C8F04DRAFT_1198413 [Mycena alexandri]KAJ7024553.1 hypothetical protein C8F04DRAFT_1192232 [Mycena alexandri]
MNSDSCRDLGLYRPVAKTKVDSEETPEFDEDGDQIPALLPLTGDHENVNTLAIFPTRISIDWSFMLSLRPRNKCTGFNLQPGETYFVDLQKGERYHSLFFDLDRTFQFNTIYSPPCQYAHLCKSHHKKQKKICAKF